MKFLLAEDDEDHAELIMYNLEKAKLMNTIYHVDDGEKAIHFLKREGEYAECERPDVVLLDLNMPKFSGLEVLDFIKNDPDYCSIPVVMLTTSDAECDRSKAYRYHANSYLVKPLDFDRFSEMIKDLSLYWGIWNCPPVLNDTKDN